MVDSDDRVGVRVGDAPHGVIIPERPAPNARQQLFNEPIPEPSVVLAPVDRDHVRLEFTQYLPGGALVRPQLLGRGCRF